MKTIFIAMTLILSAPGFASIKCNNPQLANQTLVDKVQQSLPSLTQIEKDFLAFLNQEDLTLFRNEIRFHLTEFRSLLNHEGDLNNYTTRLGHHHESARSFLLNSATEFLLAGEYIAPKGSTLYEDRRPWIGNINHPVLKRISTYYKENHLIISFCTQNQSIDLLKEGRIHFSAYAQICKSLDFTHYLGLANEDLVNRPNDYKSMLDPFLQNPIVTDLNKLPVFSQQDFQEQVALFCDKN